MNLKWFLRQDEQVCEWSIECPECRFQFKQPLQAFFPMVEELHAAMSKVKDLMAGGMDAQAAISEWERMLNGDQQQEPEQGEAVGIKIANRQELIEKVDRMVGEKAAQFDGRPGMAFMRVDMPCGSVVVYKTADMVPAESVPCPCGDPNHWVIKYEE